MSERTKRLIYLIYSSVSSLLLVASGISLIAGAYAINSHGENPYTYASISAAFSSVAPLIYLTLAVVFVGSLLSSLFYAKEEKKTPYRMLREQLERARSERRLIHDSPSERIVARERRLRLCLLVAVLFFFVNGVVLSLCYSLDAANYSDALNASTLRAFIAVMIYLLPAAAALTAYLYISDASIVRELSAWRECPKKAENEGTCDEKARENAAFSDSLPSNERILLAVRISLVLISGVLIALGVYNGGMNDVLQKAIKICTECIGLG